MTAYRVIWQADVEADNPTDAARKALDLQRDPGSVTGEFYVYVADNFLDSERVNLGGP